jgi:hypothetical protein
MTRETNPTVYRAVGLFMIVLAFINFGIQFSIFNFSGGPLSDVQDEQIGVDEGVANTPDEAAAQDLGGLSTPMGMMTLVHSPVLLVVGMMLVMLRRWEMFAVIALVIDALVKGGNILSQLAIGNDFVDAALIPLLFIVADLIASYFIYQQWQTRHNPAESRRERERVEAR